MDSNQIISSIGVGVSAIAASVTAWMAVETHRMASAAKKSLELERAPILGFRDLKVSVALAAGNDVATSAGGAVGIRVGVELINAGRVPVRYKIKAIRVTFSGRTIDAEQFASRGGRVLPGASIVYYHPLVPLDPPVVSFPANGRVRFELEYSGESETDVHTLAETIDYTVSSAAPGSRVEWIHVDEPAA